MSEMTGSGSGPEAGREHDPDDELQVRYLSLARLEPGTVVHGRYRVERLIGKGGFGMVFAAHDLALKAPVALKFLDPRSLGDGRKFLRVQREINLSRRIRDPRIVRIYSLEDESGVRFMVMERIEGQTLRERLRQSGPFRWQEFRPIFAEILAGVGSLHEQGIIHRDLKPSNIMVDGQGQVRILDFGLAKEIGDIERTSSLGEIVGSPFYLSPEQIQGAELGVASDIYQLGILLYQSLTNAYPFPETSTMSLVLMHLNRKPEPIAAQGIAAPAAVEYTVAKALAKRPRDRFRSAAEMAACLGRGRAPLLYSLGRRVPRALRLAALLAAAAFAGFAAFRATFGSAQVSSLRHGGSVLAAVNRFGRTVWRRDFAPFGVHLAHWVGDSVLWPRNRQQNPVAKLNDSLMQRLQNTPTPLALVFLSHPAKGAFAADGSVDSDRFDNQVAVLDGQGRLLDRKPYSAAFELKNHDFSRVFTMSAHRQAGRGKGMLDLFYLQNHQGMYPSALLAASGNCVAVFCSPGSIIAAQPLRSDSQGGSLLMLSASNPLSHMAFLCEWSFSPATRNRLDMPPDYFQDWSDTAVDFALMVPSNSQIVENRWLGQGWARLSEEIGHRSLRVHRNGRLEVEENGRIAAYRDDPARLNQAYGLMNECLQQRVVRRNPGKALELASRAAGLPLQNPFLRSALLNLKGDCQVDLGRYADGRRDLEEALRLYPRNNDAMKRLLEVELFEKGAAAAISLFESRYSQGKNFFGLGNHGNFLFLGYAHLAAGQAEKSREYFEKIHQERFPHAREALQGILAMFAGDYPRAAQLLREGEGKVQDLFDIREHRLLLARALVLAGIDPGRCRWILEDLAKYSLRQGHMTEVSLCYLMAREGKREEARDRIAAAFARLRQAARGDMETRLWLWYDAWVYARTMELLGDAAAARAGYRACIEANPHVALAAEARRALARR